jgi:hypothetical protein
MNMISTGAFQTEMDASSRQPTIAERFAAVWEKKNSKAARAGGVSLMALSLAACGSDDEVATATATDTTTTTTTTTTVVAAAAFDLTPLVDIASTSQALNGSLTSDFRFTSGDDTVNGMSATMANTDTLLDGSSTDNDVMNVTVTAATTATTVNIETVNITYAVAAQTFTGANSGTTTYNVGGTVAGNLATPAAGATINVTDYGRVVEIDGLVLTGTAAAGSADTLNIAVSGATHGTSAATRTGVQLDATGNDNLETLNIASDGSAANEFTLSVTNSETIGSVVTSGGQDLTIRVAEGLIDGKTVTGTASTGEVNISLDTNGNITTNAANWTGVDNINLRDSATASANSAAINSLADNQNIVVQNSVTTLTPSLQGATFSTFKTGADLELNGTSTTAGVTVTTYNGQNVTGLDIASLGLASGTSTTAANTISNLDGDFSTITITGDTSIAITDLDVEAVQTATSATTARAVVVDASSMTGNAFLSTTASVDSKVSYTITGTLGADTLVANNSGNTLHGGLSADTLTTGTGADTVTGGAGADHIDVSGGVDTLTGGAGADTYDVDVTDVAAVAQIGTLTITSSDDVWVAGNTITVTVDSVAAIYTVTASDVSGTENSDAASNDPDAIADTLANFINANFTQVTATANSGGAHIIDVTAATAGTAFTLTSADSNSGIAAVTAASTATSNTVGVDVNSTITDFAAGDILDLDGIITVATISYFEGAVASQTSHNVVVYTGTAYANFTALELAYDSVATNDTEFVGVFLNDTLGYAQVVYDNDANTQGGEELLMNLTSVTNLTDLAATFNVDSFIV